MRRRRFIQMAGAAIAFAGSPAAIRAMAAAGAPKASAGGWGGFTPTANFYVTTYGATPHVNASQWRLKIHGMVNGPLELDLAAIKALPQVNETLTLECIGNPPNGTAIGNALWAGPKLVPLLEHARPSGKAVYAKLRAADGYATGIPIDELMRKENFLPYLMNGAPLPPEHGYPMRMFIPGKYGMKQPKWLTEIEFVDKEFVGYWEARGWSNSAWRKVNSGFFYPQASYSLFDLVAPEARVRSPVEMVGWALAGPSGIRRVDISTDDGKSWKAADLSENRSPYIWTIWKYRFAPAERGRYHVRVRATDGGGRSQPPSDPDRAAGMSAQVRFALAVTTD
ncbi:MAG: molybdopterin-dependent oxidoreductase [Candidatus Binataceae bacterium]